MCYRTREYLFAAEILAPWLADDDGFVKAVAIAGSFDRMAYLIFALYATAVILGFYGFAVWCNFKVLRCLREKTNLGPVVTVIRPAHADIQNQFSRTLICQAVVPLFTFAIPVFFIVFSVLSRISIDPGFSTAFGLMFTYIPTGNALSVLFFLKSYRKRGIHFIKNGIRSFFKHQTSTISTTF
ncbi:hypothetical protein FO519_009645 [Halicephalobus sp. NKZ332]|nr:hypothetical protein FO519_009645 [Halicephalobus sp. NKZ332]